MNIIKEEFIKILRKTADDFEIDNTNLNEEQMIKIAEILTHKELSKEEAAYLIGYIVQRMHRVFRDMISTGKK